MAIHERLLEEIEQVLSVQLSGRKLTREGALGTIHHMYDSEAMLLNPEEPLSDADIEAIPAFAARFSQAAQNTNNQPKKEKAEANPEA